MKKNIMKKILLSVLCISLLAMTAACSSKADNARLVDGDLTDIFKEIYDNSGVTKPMMIGETVLTDANKVYMLGSEDVAFIEGLVSEPMVGSIAHSIVLFRVDGNTNIAATKKLIKDNINPRKWICAGVNPDQVIVDNIGDLIFVVMSPDAKAYHDSFLKLAE